MIRYGWLAVVAVAMAALAVAATPPQAERPAGTGEAAQEVGPQVEVIGLEIMKPDPAEEFHHAVVFGRRGGTTLFLRLVCPDKFLIAMDEDASGVAAFADDKGTNLIVDRGFHERFEFSFDDAEDGRSGVIEVESPDMPAAGASRLELKADLVFKCGADEQTVEQKDFALKPGSELVVGPAPMKIDEIGGPWGESKMQVTLKGPTSPEAIKELVFLGADGKPIKARITMTGRSGSPGHMTYSRTYALAEKVETATVRITYFAKVETLTVPVNIKVGVGF